MNLRTVLTLAAIVGCLGPAVAMVSNLPLIAIDGSGAQAPAQVYVRDASGSLRPARPDDDPGALVFDAQGSPLYFTLEKWRAGGGSVDVAPDTEGSGDLVTVNAHRLIAFGHYSVFIRSDGGSGNAHLLPLDGSGITNNFDSRQDGAASVIISTPQHLASGTELVVVYHSDDQDHGVSPGELLYTAHAQLTARMP